MKRKTAGIAALLTAGVAIPGIVTVSAWANETDTPAALDGEFYTDPGNNAYAWLEDNPDSDNAEQIKTKIADNVVANWYGTQHDEPWENTPVDEYVAAAGEAGQTPVLVAYNMFERDCGGASDGGASSADSYKSWIDDFSTAIGDHEAVVILEPDAVAQLVAGDCDLDTDTRKELLSYGVKSLADNAPNAVTYLDAGNADWPADPAATAKVLQDSGVEQIRGFAMNVSNHYTTDESDATAAKINDALGGEAGYVVDTSRNGSGRTQDGQDAWCNPEGATLGETSTSVDGPADAHLWVKVPGDSDGPCGYLEDDQTPAGEFTEKMATALITGEYT